MEHAPKLEPCRAHFACHKIRKISNYDEIVNIEFEKVKEEEKEKEECRRENEAVRLRATQFTESIIM